MNINYTGGSMLTAKQLWNYITNIKGVTAQKMKFSIKDFFSKFD